MRRLGFVAAVLLGWLIVIACGRPSASEQSRPSPRAGLPASHHGLPAPLLSYFAEEKAGADGGYKWMFWNPASGKAQVFMPLEGKPKLCCWDTREMRVYFTIDSRIFSATYPQASAVPSYVAEVPPHDEQVMWMERSSSRLRVITLEEIPDDSITRNAGGTSTYRLADGSSIPGSDFPAGAPAVCTVWELSPSRKWIRIARQATKEGCDDCPELNAVDSFRHERGASQLSLLTSYSCKYYPGCGEALPRPLVQLLHAAGHYSAEDFQYIPRGDGLAGLVLRTAGESDFAYARDPLFLVWPGSRRLFPIKHSPAVLDQLGIGINGRYLLIAEEYTGDNPTVVDLETGATVFTEAVRAAVWVP